jgi:hypothetical protein
MFSICKLINRKVRRGGIHMSDEQQNYTDHSISGQVVSEYIIVIALIAISAIGLFAAIGA